MSNLAMRAVLVGLIVYQVVVYGFVVRAYMHMSVVLLPWLMGEAGYRMYDTINIGYPPGWLWLNTAFYRLIPDHELRLRSGTILIAIVITLIVFALARRWWGARAGLFAAALFAAWGPLMLEYLMYFEFVLGLFAVAALAAWHKHDARWWQPLLVGVLVGVAVIVKQHALAVVVVYAVWRLAGLDWKAALFDILRFTIGAALPVAAVVLVLGAQGVLEHALYLMFGSHGAYFETAVQTFEVRELLLLVLWLALVPVFVLKAVLQREAWRSQDILLLGLLVALLVPAYPRYGRFHLSGAVPIASLISTGALIYLLSVKTNQIARIYAALAATALLVVGVALPVYYRVRLGEITSQYTSLQPLSKWVQEQTDAPTGTRMWILPDIDPTANFYAISGYYPPMQYAQTYSWIVAAPAVYERVMWGLEADPPQYVIRVDDWRFQIPAGMHDYVETNYTPVAQTVIPTDIHNVTLYRRNTP